MEERYDALVEYLDKKTSRWWAFPAFLATIAVVWSLVGYDYANFYVSIVTVCFFFLLQYAGRKDRLSNQIKHDTELKETTSDTVAIEGMERKTLSEIENYDRQS